ncbi:MAG TPA: type IV pilus assembly protein PilM [Coriobacteriia bacterium]|nr:type IV pilus assembly protein PilM [Coriobacteriia bacterium]
MGLISMGSGVPPVGLDIGTDHVRAAVLKSSGSAPTLTAYACVDMPMGAVIDGEIVNPAAVSAAIRELWGKPGIKGREVVTGVSNQKVVVRLVDLPFMEHDELKGAIQYQAQDFIPIPVEEAILDFQIIGDYMTSGDEHMMEVLLVAAQRDTIDSTVAAVEGAGLKLAAIDVTSFAIVRSTLGGGQSVLAEDDEAPDEAVAVIHIGSGLTNIAVVEKGVPRFTRVSSLSGNQFTQAVANQLNLTFDEAEHLKISAGLPDLSTNVPVDHETADDAALRVAAVQDALEREVSKFITEVRRSLDYYLTQTTQARTIRRIHLTGSSAQLANLPLYLEKGLQAEVVLSDPLRFVQVGAGAKGAAEQDRMGAAPAVGLALGGVA